MLSACGANEPEIAEYIERPVEKIYNEAFDELERRNFISAAQQFDEVERQHPYSIWARRAMVMAALAPPSHAWDVMARLARQPIALPSAPITVYRSSLTYGGGLLKSWGK